MSEGYYYKYTQTSWRTIVVLLGNHNAVIIFYTQNIHTEILTERTNVRYIFGFQMYSVIYVGSDKFLITFKLALKSQSIFGKNKSLSN